MNLRKALLVAVTALTLTGCSTSGPSEPTEAQRSAYQAAIVARFGSEYVDSIPDRASFESEAYAAGLMACTYHREGKSTAEYQEMFGKQASASAQSTIPDPAVLDAMSLALWSAALTYLCPSSIQASTSGLAIPKWAIIVGAIFGIPLVLWGLSLLIGMIQFLFMKPQTRRATSEFISAWELISLKPVEHLTEPERRIVREMMSRFVQARRSGSPLTAREYIMHEISREGHDG